MQSLKYDMNYQKKKKKKIEGNRLPIKEYSKELLWHMLSAVVRLPWKRTPSGNKFLSPCPSSKNTGCINCRSQRTVIQNTKTLISFSSYYFMIKMHFLLPVLY